MSTELSKKPVLQIREAATATGVVFTILCFDWYLTTLDSSGGFLWEYAHIPIVFSELALAGAWLAFGSNCVSVRLLLALVLVEGVVRVFDVPSQFMSSYFIMVVAPLAIIRLLRNWRESRLKPTSWSIQFSLHQLLEMTACAAILCGFFCLHREEFHSEPLKVGLIRVQTVAMMSAVPALIGVWLAIGTVGHLITRLVLSCIATLMVPTFIPSMFVQGTYLEMLILIQLQVLFVAAPLIARRFFVKRTFRDASVATA